MNHKPDETSKSEKPWRVLIVDDHQLVRFALEQALEGNKEFEVCGYARRADEALRLIETDPPDTAVVDLTLEEGTGLNLLEELRSRFPTIRSIVLTAHDDYLFADRALRAGAMGFVNKKEDMETVVKAMRMAMDDKMYLSASMKERMLTNMARTPQSSTPSVTQLSNRELEVFEMVGKGMSSREIADSLHLSVKTIETHKDHIKSKLALQNHQELVRRAVVWVLEGV